MLDTKLSSQAETRRALSTLNVWRNEPTSAIAKNLEYRLITANTDDAGTNGTTALTAASQVARLANLPRCLYESRSTPERSPHRDETGNHFEPADGRDLDSIRLLTKVLCPILIDCNCSILKRFEHSEGSFTRNLCGLVVRL